MDFVFGGVELRQEAGQGPRLAGVAAPIEKFTTVKETPLAREMEKKGKKRYREKFAKGAFKNVVEQSKTGKKNVNLLRNHRGKPLASTKDGTLRLSNTDRGLEFEVDIPIETKAGRDLFNIAESGGIRGVSVGLRNPRKPSQMINKGNSLEPPEQPSIIPTPLPDADAPLEGSTIVVGTNGPTKAWGVVLDADMHELSIISAPGVPVYKDTTAELRAMFFANDEIIKLKNWICYYENVI